MKCLEYLCTRDGNYFIVTYNNKGIDEQIQDKEGRCLKHVRELYRTESKCYPDTRVAVYKITLEWSNNKQFTL